MNEEQLIIQNALDLVKSAQGVGVDKTRLLDTVRTLNGAHLSPEQKDYVWNVLTTRGWIIDHLDPLWHGHRWCLTPSGLTALEAM